MAAYEIKLATVADRTQWDAYVRGHENASVYHCFGWADAIRKAYGHATYLLMLTLQARAPGDGATQADATGQPAAHVAGVLPLVHLKHALFGNCLVSMPFADAGGILADSPEAEARLLAEAVRLGRQRGAASVELRHERLLASCAGARPPDAEASGRGSVSLSTRSHKSRMLLQLPGSSSAVLPSFTSKLRSQVNKALKQGFTTRIGGPELLDDFYDVFAENMRDLGSPVHSARLMQEVLAAFFGDARLVVVYRSQEPVAAALVVGFGNTMRNPWASSLRKYASLGPNMLLYLRLLEHACENGYRMFDFGRSSPGDGTYRFKEQWGAAPAPLYWHSISLDGRVSAAEGADRAGFGLAARCWRRLPVALTRVIGPRIRKHISL